MTVGEMLEKMSAFEFAMWMAYCRVENERMEDARKGKSPEALEAQEEVDQQRAIGLLEKKGMKPRKKITAT